MLIKGKINFGQFVYVIDNSYQICQEGTRGLGATFFEPNRFIVLQSDLKEEDIPQSIGRNNDKFNDTVIYHEQYHKIIYIHSGFLRAFIESK